MPSDESKQSCTQTFLQDFDSLTSSKSKMDHYCKFDYASMVDYWNCSKEVFNMSNYGKTWHLGPKQSKYDERVVFCSRNSYIDDNIYDSEKIETAEKATLTEPEEELWREKALAPFIDESIWSLYSSESDIQVKHFPFEPLLSEPSLEKLITNCSPCIIVTKDINSDDSEASNSPEVNKFYEPKLDNTFNQKQEPFKPGLERVASDTVLYLKDAICELENEMHRGLKSSKNISTLHNSGSESETSPVSGCRLKRDFIMNLESTMRDQDHLAWPSPSRSSSTSSLQSSTSCHVISDETDDVDMMRTSRKGSQDPDLSSASDAEYENLEHKDFVERWLQKEVAHNAPKSLVPQLEPVEEAVETTPPLLRRKASLPSKTVENTVRPRNRFMSYPTGASSQKINFTTVTHPPKNPQIPASKSAPVSSESNVDGYSNETDFADDTEFQGVDSEAKEFNGDFYKLCSVGSMKSLDRCSPARKTEAQFKYPNDPLACTKKPSSMSTTKLVSSKPEKSKPTGLVKPTRPVTLTISSVPTVPGHSKPKSSAGVRRPTDFRVSANQNLPSKSNPDVLYKVNCDFTKSESRAKANHSFQVPQKHILVVTPQCDTQTNITTENRAHVDKTSPFSRLPALDLHSKEHLKSAKVKSPTRMVFKSSSSPMVSPSKSEAWLKRQQWKREQRVVARQNRLKEGCGTAWVHLQAKPELSDPTARSHLLDSLKAPTSSSGSSSTEEEEEDVFIIQTNSHLHKICRERRHKVKASANNPLFDMKKRTSIMGRRELFYRFGDKEREAIACFDFLEEIPSASQETLTAPPEDPHPLQRLATPPSDLGSESFSNKERISFLSPTVEIASRSHGDHPTSKTIDWSRSPFSSFRRLRLPNLWNQPLSHNMSSSTLSQDCEILDHISLSDSCAESYSSSTPESYEDAS
ncbi:uncharacterized protein LOC129226420 [Uloborus diversus]|uniref:uncharacterized protein LOC129226420 n=1 Tax=Uloborus diversus TaxID=327109 RepID=UPI0024090725|nr:uncharacterized protein LOC129226420 [Uloborus diversus]